MSILSVSQLNRYVAFAMKEDPHLRSVILRGEISNFTRNFRSGHCYFALRDEEASIKAVMFRFQAEHLKYEPRNGMHVIAQGAVSIYEKDGTYQINITDMQPDGIGAQALALQQRREKLAKLGFFAPERKRVLPAMPKKIGIVTSKSGAALHDMLQVLGRRYPIGNVCIFPALVQGDSAPASIAEALKTAGAYGCDLILMGRGGGSNEDLSAFQSEEVAYAVFQSPVPVISAVGHETDHCIADEVADLRAPTPSAAAELAVADISELQEKINSLHSRLSACFLTLLADKEKKLQNVIFRLERRSLHNRLLLHDTKLREQTSRLNDALKALLNQKSQEWLLAAEKLEAVSPLAVLKRGYALVYNGKKLIQDVNQLNKGDMLTLQLANGCTKAEVKEIISPDTEVSS